MKGIVVKYHLFYIGQYNIFIDIVRITEITLINSFKFLQNLTKVWGVS